MYPSIAKSDRPTVTELSAGTEGGPARILLATSRRFQAAVPMTLINVGPVVVAVGAARVCVATDSCSVRAIGPSTPSTIAVAGPKVIS